MECERFTIAWVKAIHPPASWRSIILTHFWAQANFLIVSAHHPQRGPDLLSLLAEAGDLQGSPAYIDASGQQQVYRMETRKKKRWGSKAPPDEMPAMC
jgi:hypothetical protein